MGLKRQKEKSSTNTGLKVVREMFGSVSHVRRKTFSVTKLEP